MDEKEKDRRAAKLVEVLDLKFNQSEKWWSEPRCSTTWGTKTRKGMIATIKRIMFEEG